MHRTLPALLATPLLAACGYKQDDFAADYAEAWCQVWADCELLDVIDYESADECRAVVEPTRQEDHCADYDMQMAQECIDGILAMTCDDLYDEAPWPSACDSACE